MQARVNYLYDVVAPRKGSVDRNHDWNEYDLIEIVAPRKGSVDRNNARIGLMRLSNSRSPQGERGSKWRDDVETLVQVLSLPARGAWIEITWNIVVYTTVVCRSPQGERGSKSITSDIDTKTNASLPARGAWIEIAISTMHTRIANGRSPQGERGSKPANPTHQQPSPRVAPRKGSVDRNPSKRSAATYSSRSLPARGAWIEIYNPILW